MGNNIVVVDSLPRIHYRKVLPKSANGRPVGPNQPVPCGPWPLARTDREREILEGCRAPVGQLDSLKLAADGLPIAAQRETEWQRRSAVGYFVKDEAVVVTLVDLSEKFLPIGHGAAAKGIIRSLEYALGEVTIELLADDGETLELECQLPIISPAVNKWDSHQGGLFNPPGQLFGQKIYFDEGAKYGLPQLSYETQRALANLGISTLAGLKRLLDKYHVDFLLLPGVNGDRELADKFQHGLNTITAGND